KKWISWGEAGKKMPGCDPRRWWSIVVPDFWTPPRTRFGSTWSGPAERRPRSGSRTREASSGEVVTAPSPARPLGAESPPPGESEGECERGRSAGEDLTGRGGRGGLLASGDAARTSWLPSARDGGRSSPLRGSAFSSLRALEAGRSGRDT